MLSEQLAARPSEPGFEGFRAAAQVAGAAASSRKAYKALVSPEVTDVVIGAEAVRGGRAGPDALREGCDAVAEFLSMVTDPAARLGFQNQWAEAVVTAWLDEVRAGKLDIIFEGMRTALTTYDGFKHAGLTAAQLERIYGEGYVKAQAVAQNIQQQGFVPVGGSSDVRMAGAAAADPPVAAGRSAFDDLQKLGSTCARRLSVRRWMLQRFRLRLLCPFCRDCSRG